MCATPTHAATAANCIDAEGFANSGSQFLYLNKVYDATGFSHPGGFSKLKQAFGNDVAAIWPRRHSTNKHVQKHLKKMETNMTICRVDVSVNATMESTDEQTQKHHRLRNV
jgi:cytochrome b involved in lipid metabolism